MNAQFTIGADPEVFVKHRGVAVSVSETGLRGDKKNPHKTSVGAVQQDGFAAEFNIDPSPISDFNRFNQNIVRTIADLREELNKSGKEYNLAIQPVMDFDPDYMAAQPDHVKELGCDPDYNAYTGEANPRPEGDRPFRSGAGHIHYGWGADIPVDNEDHFEICSGFVRVLDATVGMFMCYIDRDARRRDLYGKAGAFRPKPYGVEYRTPSNLWITTKSRRLLVHTLSNWAISRHVSGISIEKMTGGYTSEDIQTIINTGNFAAAEGVVNRIISGGYFTSSVESAWGQIQEAVRKEQALLQAA